MKFINFLIIVLIFAGGVYVGNKYLPQKNHVSDIAVALPALNVQSSANPADFTADAAVKKLTQAPTDPDTIKFAQTTILTLDYRVKKNIFAAEIAKNNPETNVSSSYLDAASNFNSAKKNLEKYFNDQYPPQQPALPPQPQPQPEQQQPAQVQNPAPTPAPASQDGSTQK